MAVSTPARNNFLVPVFILSVMIFTGTVAHAQRKFLERAEKEYAAGRDSSKNVFLVTKSGQMIAGNEISFTPHKKNRGYDIHKDWIAIDGQQVPYDSVDIYQTPDAYSARPKPEINHGYFIHRLRYGKIDLYSYVVDEEVGNGHWNTYHAYAFKKGSGEIRMLIKQDFSDAVSDNSAVLAEFNNAFPGRVPRFAEKENLRNLIAIIEEYNK